MNLNKLHQILTSGYSLLIISLLYFLGIRIWKVGLGEQHLWIAIGLQLLTALSVLFLNHYFRIVREKTFLPPVFYLLFVSIDPLFFLAWKESLFVLCTLFCFYFLFQSYEKECPQRQTLNIGIFLTAGTLFHPSFYILFPLFFWGLYRFKSLNPRTFLAVICGSLVVYLFLFCWCLHQDDPALFLRYFPDWNVFLPEFFEFNLGDSLILVFMLLLLILSGVNVYLADIPEKIKNHIILSFLFFFSLFLFVLMFVEWQWEIEWRGLLNLSSTLLISYFFSLRISRAKVFLLILSVVLFMGAGIWNLY